MAPLYECLGLEQSDERTGSQGVAYALESLGRPIFIFILFLGHYPWDPPPKIEPSVSNLFQLRATFCRARILKSNFSSFVIGSFRKRVRSGEAGSVKRIIIQRVIQGIG